jgi:ribosomal protein L40E
VRVECESCREIVVASFAIDGHTVRATCPACHHVMSVPETGREAVIAAVIAQGVPEDAAPRVAGDAAGDAALCPKCGAVRGGDATACGTCGLAADRMAAYLDARDAAVPDPVREAWARAAAAWDDDARHDDLLGLVASHNAYAWAAGRYRTRGDDAIARRQLDRLRRAAEATMLASATARPAAETRPYRGTAGVLAVLVIVIVIGLFYAVVIRDHPPSRPRPAPAGPGTPGSAGGVRPLVPGHPVSPSTIR